MDYAKSVLLFLVGVVVASAFFVFDLDRVIPRSMRFWRAEPIALAVVPSGPSGSYGCPVNYAVDNRTDRLVFFSLADQPQAYGPPARDDARWNDPNYDRGAARYAEGSMFGDVDATRFTNNSNPESSEPGIKPTDDPYPNDSNYGGSSTQFGSEGPPQYDQGDQGYQGDDAARTDQFLDGDRDSSYGNRSWSNGYYGSGGYRQPAPSPDVFAGNQNSVPPPPPGQPIPLTPPENSSPYGALPPASAYGPPTNNYGPPADGGYGPNGPFGAQANKVRPGEIVFASSGGEGGGFSPRCEGARNTVTIQLSD